MANVRVIPPREKEPAILRVAAYCRVSSDSSDQLHSYAAQIRGYTEEIRKHENWTLVDVYADEGLTGTRMDKREDFNRMLSDCRKGRIDKILVKSVSRFARNTKDCLASLRELTSLGVSVYFEKENIRSETLTTELMVSVSGALAQQESISIAQNQRMSYQRRMERGEFITCTAPLGYRLVDGKNLEIEEAETDIVRWIFDSYLAGRSAEWIAEQMTRRKIPTAWGRGIWREQTIRKILANEKYIGDGLRQKTFTTGSIGNKKVMINRGEKPMYYTENNHPAIIPRDIFYRVKEEMARRASKRKVMQKTGKTEQGKYSAKYALSELLVCGECGTPYKRVTWARNGKKRIVWRCVSRLEFGRDYCHESPTLDEGRLHRAIVDALNEYGAIRAEVKAGVLELAGLAQSHGEAGGVSPLELKQRLDTLTAEQAVLLDKILEDMGNKELNAQLEAVTAEKQDILDRIQALEKDESRQAMRASRQREMEEWLDRQELRFTEYEDTITRRFVERITVVDADTIRVKIKDVDVVIDRKLC